MQTPTDTTTTLTLAAPDSVQAGPAAHAFVAPLGLDSASVHSVSAQESLDSIFAQAGRIFSLEANGAAERGANVLDGDSIATFRLADVPIIEAEERPGEPLPYTLGGDDVIAGVVLLCAALIAVVMKLSWQYFRSTVSTVLFRAPNRDSMRSTDREMSGMAFLVLQTAVSTAILYFGYLQIHVDRAILPESPYITLGLTAAATLAYIAVKAVLYSAVNGALFGREGRQQWHKAYLFSVVSTGLLLFPVAALAVFSNLSTATQIVLGFSVFALGKGFLAISCYNIFFRRPALILHLFSYLCALEVAPALMVWRVLLWLNTNITEWV